MPGEGVERPAGAVLVDRAGVRERARLTRFDVDEHEDRSGAEVAGDGALEPPVGGDGDADVHDGLLLTGRGGSERLRVRGVDVPPLEPQAPSASEHFGHLPVRRVEDSPESGPRDPHPPRGLFLVQPFLVGQPDRLELVERHHDLFEQPGGDARGLEEDGAGRLRRSSGRRRDVASSREFRTYAQNTIRRQPPDQPRDRPRACAPGSASRNACPYITL